MDKYVYWRYNVSMEVKAMNTSNITNYKPKKFAELLNVTVKTLQHWDREKILVANRTPQIEDITPTTSIHSSKALAKMLILER